VLAGLKKRLFKPRICKEPFLLVHVHEFITVMDTNSLTDIRNTVLIVLAFYAFLRSDELLSITFNDVKFEKTHMELYIAKAKTDQLREGRSVLVAKLESKFCPVSIVQSYYLKAQKYSKLTDFLFRRIIIQKKEAILYSKNVKITYSNLRDIVVRKVGQIGLCSKNYGTHSMRAGGSTLAANNGVPDRLFQRHGRWASVEAKNGYIKDNTEAKLSVTKAMV
jgi:integrase